MTRATASRVAIVIPAYNESKTIRDVTARTLRHAQWTVVVDDGSGDGTVSQLDGMPITVLRNPANLGKAASLHRGMRWAMEKGADAIVTLDGDGQHRPEDIPRLLAEWEHARDALVIGARLQEKDNIPPARYYANRFANFWISWAAGQAIIDSQSGFRIYPAKLLRAVLPACSDEHGFVFESEVLIEAGRQGFAVRFVDVPAIYSEGSRPSHFRPVADIARIVRMVAWKLLSRGLYLQGLVRSLRERDLHRPAG